MSQCSRPLPFCIHFALLLAFPLMFSSCAQQGDNPTTEQVKFVQTTIDAVTIDLELAINRQDQINGLMFRKSLPSDQGMLFIFDKPKPQSFWMKNTLIPLDIAYIDPSGKICEIYPMFPNNQNSVKSHSSEIQFALEVNQGWFRSKGILPGAYLDLGPLRPILKISKIQLPETEE